MSWRGAGRRVSDRSSQPPLLPPCRVTWMTNFRGPSPACRTAVSTDGCPGSMLPTTRRCSIPPGRLRSRTAVSPRTQAAERAINDRGLQRGGHRTPPGHTCGVPEWATCLDHAFHAARSSSFDETADGRADALSAPGTGQRWRACSIHFAARRLRRSPRVVLLRLCVRGRRAVWRGGPHATSPARRAPCRPGPDDDVGDPCARAGSRAAPLGYQAPDIVAALLPGASKTLGHAGKWIESGGDLDAELGSVAGPAARPLRCRTRSMLLIFREPRPSGGRSP
jgi:hypothetical protein